MARVYAIIPAAGTGSRMATKTKKQYLELNGLPVLVHTLKVFEQCPLVEGIVLVTGEDELDWCQQEIVDKYGIEKVLSVVPGGDHRQLSVYNGLKSLPAEKEDIVMVHDGARPLITNNEISNAASAAREKGAVVVAVPVKDTIKVVGEGQKVVDTPSRDSLWAVQTPQVFKYHVLMNAYVNAFKINFLGTDDASLVERMGQAVYLVTGSYQNIKITTPEDMLLAEAILKGRQGY
ncbi:MAG: 2-C-methyl-D-erythritol 4-phosphate cytidylyltransferase [Firmicutes bacterium]|nr:2-C-methyl-D-erythritol 4-phosphate cytidylyltransferase [Bacillota bacterium]